MPSDLTPERDGPSTTVTPAQVAPRLEADERLRRRHYGSIRSSASEVFKFDPPPRLGQHDGSPRQERIGRSSTSTIPMNVACRISELVRGARSADCRPSRR